MISLRFAWSRPDRPVVCSGFVGVPFLRHVVADSAFRYAKMFGDFLGGFFVFGERASSGIPHNFSGEIHRSDFLFAPFWLPLSACIFEKAVGVMLVHVHLATLLAT
jgi:hypothetical protein